MMKNGNTENTKETQSYTDILFSEVSDSFSVALCDYAAQLRVILFSMEQQKAMDSNFTEFQKILKTNPDAILLVNINVDRATITAARQAGNYVYIGKTSEWGNPFQVAWDGSQQEVLEKYRAWIQKQPELIAKLPSLRGKVLGCYCVPRPCHGDILIELATAGVNASRL